MSLSTKSSNDDQNLSLDAQLNLQTLNDVLPLAGPSQSADASRKRSIDQFDGGDYKPADPNNIEDLRARMDAINAKRQKIAPQVDEDVVMTATEGSKVKIDITGPAPPPAWRLDWKNIKNPGQAPKVAVQVGEYPVIGNTGIHPEGYGINLLLDGGINAQPSVGLVIRINKENSGQALTEKREDVHRFVLQYPINKVLGQDDEGKDIYMVDSFNHMAFNPSEAPGVENDLYRQGMLATRSSKPNNHFKILAVQMLVNGVNVTEGGTAEDLQAVVQEHPDTMFSEAVTQLLIGSFP